jgi:MPBQ/MSBQ methyltransferase
MTSAIDPEDVSFAHNAMAEEYDELADLWYPWLFAIIHDFIARNLLATKNYRPRAVDAGCGTGFQTFLLARAGFETTGFDIAEKLLGVARTKTEEGRTGWQEGPLFHVHSPAPWLPRYERRLEKRLLELRAGRRIVKPTFALEDIERFPFGENAFDVITCCGSVLSFVNEYGEVIACMTRGLKAGGRLFIEVEQKRNLDLLWPILDRFKMGALEYEQTWREIWANLIAPPGKSVRVDYPFELLNGGEVVLPITLFSVRELAKIFATNNLRIVDRLGIHAVTNLIPSTLLHRASPNRTLVRTFECLREIEERVARTWPVWRLGCSVVYCLEKKT